MSLKYTDSQQVQISRKDGFRISTVNTVIRRLIENDLSFFGIGVQPTVWERRWYNDENNSGLYYKKGDAVWVNTEPADEFVRAHIADIDRYAQERSDVRYKLMVLSAENDTAGIYQLYRDMALGLGDFDKELYYLGNLLDPVQIRISLSDDNNMPPSDNGWWADFFDRTHNESFYRRQILSAAEAQLSSTYEKHLIDYHLSGLQDPGGFCEKYLRSDLANIGKTQKFVNHAWYQSDMTGFDHVLRFVIQTFDKNSGQYRWFRIWKSGYLEHGGVVSVNRTIGNDSIDSASRLFTVGFSWKYGGDKTAPSYDYPVQSIGGFYSHDRQIYTGGVNASDYVPAPDALGRTYRYVVDIQPIQSLGASVAAGPYPKVECDRFLRYPGREVTKMNNSSFTFLFAPGISTYSYYVKGFTTAVARYY